MWDFLVKKSWWIVFLSMVQMLALAALVSPDFVYQNRVQEQKWQVRALGYETAYEIRAKAKDLYKNIILEPQVEETIHHFFIPTQQERYRSSGLEDLGMEFWPYIEDRIDALMEMIYWLCHRIFLLMMWLPVTVPAFIIAFICGGYERAIKQTNFSHASPILHNYAWKLSGLTIGVTLLSFLLPIAVPPEVIPAIIIVVMMLLGVSMANLVKRI